MFLLAVKTDEGYVRQGVGGNLELVELHKASVFPEKREPQAVNLKEAAIQRGWKGVRITRLCLTETDDFL